MVFFHTDSSSYWDLLPLNVKKWHKTVSNSLPVVVVTDPGCENLYGVYNHGSLKGKDYRKILSHLRKKIKDAREAGNYVKSTEEVVEPDATKKTKDLDYETWTSSKGSTVKAKLISASQDEAVFKLQSGKQVTVSSKDLSEESWKRVVDHHASMK